MWKLYYCWQSLNCDSNLRLIEYKLGSNIFIDCNGGKKGIHKNDQGNLIVSDMKFPSEWKFNLVQIKVHMYIGSKPEVPKFKIQFNGKKTLIFFF